MKKGKENKNAVAQSNYSESMNDKVQITYQNAFLHTSRMQKRGSKSIYLSTEHHERLSRIVQVIGDDKIPLYAYLHNILEHHFNLFEKVITDDFNKNFKPIF